MVIKPKLNLISVVIQMLNLWGDKKARRIGYDAAVTFLQDDHYFPYEGEYGHHHYGWSREFAEEWIEQYIIDPLREYRDALGCCVPDQLRKVHVPFKLNGTRHEYTDYPLHALMKHYNGESDEPMYQLWSDRGEFVSGKSMSDIKKEREDLGLALDDAESDSDRYDVKDKLRQLRHEQRNREFIAHVGFWIECYGKGTTKVNPTEDVFE
ncbi:MAG: hypothetical protein Unbinned3806contig1000_54 [Prokaryotic dsDNA virus sp.]|nr:MAG: hypothetical protein Unbinned3806contig1000_54 [Prokaryotic dsDNA virus sp.]|tara:strand:+ start:4145 stop:4771 length:627 start_codon:yes stop_codon:yes gene_type:complete